MTTNAECAREMCRVDHAAIPAGCKCCWCIDAEATLDAREREVWDAAIEVVERHLPHGIALALRELRAARDKVKP